VDAVITAGDLDATDLDLARRSFITGFWRPNALKSSMNPLALQLQSAFCNCV
jgi:hypothetical protein